MTLNHWRMVGGRDIEVRDPDRLFEHPADVVEEVQREDTSELDWLRSLWNAADEQVEAVQSEIDELEWLLDKWTDRSAMIEKLTRKVEDGKTLSPKERAAAEDIERKL